MRLSLLDFGSLLENNILFACCPILLILVLMLFEIFSLSLKFQSYLLLCSFLIGDIFSLKLVPKALFSRNEKSPK